MNTGPNPGATEPAAHSIELDKHISLQAWIKVAFLQIEATFAQRQKGLPVPKISRLGPEELLGTYLALPAEGYFSLCDLLQQGCCVAWLSGSLNPLDLVLDLLAYRSGASIHRLCSGCLRDSDWSRLAHTSYELVDAPVCIVQGAADLTNDRALEAVIAASFGRSPNRRRVLVSQHASAHFESFDLPERRRSAVALATRLRAAPVFISGSCCQCELLGIACVEHGVQAWTSRSLGPASRVGLNRYSGGPPLTEGDAVKDDDGSSGARTPHAHAAQLARGGDLPGAFKLLVQSAARLTNAKLALFVLEQLLPVYRDLQAANAVGESPPRLQNDAERDPFLENIFPSPPLPMRDIAAAADALALRKLRGLVRRVALEDLFGKHALRLDTPWPDSECPPGWLPMIDELLGEIASLGCTSVMQIKEKLGGLRIYLDSSAPGVESAVWRAVERAKRICPQCGATGLEPLGRPEPNLCASCAPPHANGSLL